MVPRKRYKKGKRKTKNLIPHTIDQSQSQENMLDWVITNTNPYIEVKNG